MEYEIVFAPDSRDDLPQFYRLIAKRFWTARAQAYTVRIVSYCLGFATFPERGIQRDDLRPGLRIIGFRRRVTIAFHVMGGRVTIDRVLYGGRDLSKAFRNPAKG